MSLYVKLNKPHRHNGKLCRRGEKVRIPTATALAMINSGQAQMLEGPQLVEAKAEAKTKKKAKRVAKAKAKADDRK